LVEDLTGRKSQGKGGGRPLKKTRRREWRADQFEYCTFRVEREKKRKKKTVGQESKGFGEFKSTWTTFWGQGERKRRMQTMKQSVSWKRTDQERLAQVVEMRPCSSKKRKFAKKEKSRKRSN